jgi:gliding motility-associated protein GldC
MSEVKTTKEIRIRVGLNAENVPVQIDWEAEDHTGAAEPQECKAFLLSLFDKEKRETLRIDLWTVDMQVIEMDRLFYNTLRSMADTYFRATQNKELAQDMQRFVHYFGEKTEVIPRET